MPCLNKKQDMKGIRFNLLIITSIMLFLCTNVFSAQSTKTTNYRQKTQVKHKSASAIKEDSILNAPTEEIKIEYDEKDIPIEFVLKLDSSLHNYQLSFKDSTLQPCQEDSTFTFDTPDSIIVKRLSDIPSIVELCYNDIVRKYIELYLAKRRKLTSFIVGESERYFPMFTDALESESVPVELRNLAVIESALNPRAYSPAGASGLWQFMSSTGSLYGLKVNSLVDERRDPVKSTYAAAKYLKHLYGIYEDWTLAIAAYNCGPGNVNKALRRTGGKKDYWDIYEYLPKETRGYVPAFIAANYVMNYYSEYNICPIRTEYATIVDTIQIEDKVHLKQIANVLGLELDEIRDLNPQYRHDIIPGGRKYTLCLPVNRINQYEMYKNTILSQDVIGYTKHREQVEPTKRYHTTYNTKNRSQQRATVHKNTAENSSKSSIKHVVKQGDTLYSIANRNGVSVIDIKRWNGLRSDKLSIGQTIIIRK